MSILDFKQKDLCDEIWGKDLRLLPEVQSFIVETITFFFKQNDVVGWMKYIDDMMIGSSLATFYYKKDSDFDIKVIIDAEKIMRLNRITGITPHEYAQSLTKVGRKDYYLTNFIPGTQHQIDVYFYDVHEFYPIHFNKYDSLYSIKNNEWLEPPKDIFIDNNPQAVLDIAWEKAYPYIHAISEDILVAKKNIIDFILFEDYLKSLDGDDLQSIYPFFMKKFNEVNSNINELISDRDDLKAFRMEAFSKESLDSELEKLMGSYNYSEGNLIFKIAQRYGIMKILKEIDSKVEEDGVTPDNAEDYLNILSL